MNNSATQPPRSFYIIVPTFCLVFLHCLWALSREWSAPILDNHAFRQTQTAISTYYILKGGPWIDYHTPVLGIPWSIPFEFPLYQWIVALVVTYLETPLIPAGRLTTAVFYLLCLLPTYYILGTFSVSRIHRLIVFSFFLASPKYLFYSRAFLMESLALFLSLSYLALVIRYYQKQSNLFTALLASLFGVAAALTKITTFLAPAVGASLICLHFLWKQRSRIPPKVFKENKGKSKSLGNSESDIVKYLVIPLVLFAALPYLAISYWVSHADSLKGLNVLAGNSITSTALESWHFGSIEQRLPSNMYFLFKRDFYRLWGTYFPAGLALVALPFLSKRWLLSCLASFLFLLPILVFTNLFFVHTYYFYGNGIFLFTALGLALIGLLEKGGGAHIIGMLFFLLFLGLQLRWYWTEGSEVYYHQNKEILSVADAIKKNTSEDQVVFIKGLDWSSELPFYSERRAIMVMRKIKNKGTWISEAIERIPAGRIGAFVFCNEARAKEKNLNDTLLMQYGFSEKEVYRDKLCSIYLPNTRV